METVNQFNFR